MTPLCRPTGRLWIWSLVAVVAGGLVAAAPPVAAQTDADHLIFSEVVTTANRFGARFIEIVNPTTDPVPMQDVHLTNGTFQPNDAGYWRLVEPEASSATAGGGVGGTFHGRFPDGYMLAAGDTIVVAVNGSTEFEARYGYLPDFEIYEDAEVPDAVPELVEVFPGSIGANVPAAGGNAVTLSSNDGSLALYRWDGTTELVADLDYVHWGTNVSFRVNKTGYTSGSATYLDDTPVASQIPLPGSAGDGRSYLRTSASEGTENTPGNGATGHDETSEDLGTTWSVVTPQAPAAAPASWHPAAPIFTGATQLPSRPYAGQVTAVTVTVVSAGAISGVDIVYTVDGQPAQTLTATDAGAGQWQAEIPAQAEGAVVRWWASATNTGGGSAVHPAAAPRYSEGWTTQAEPVGGEGAVKLLLTEICTLGSDQEFIEIWNPTDQNVDLSDYYLTDAVYFPNNTGYWNIGGGVLNADTIGGGSFTDFHARFPAGYTIAAGDTIVVSVAGSDAFFGAYGFLPDLELYELGAPDQVPDMRWVFGSAGDNSIVSPSSTPSLTNTGEPVILYHYAQGDDLVTDIDVFLWQAGTTTSYLFSKTDIMIGTSTYQDETPVANQQPFPTELTFGDSYQRADPNEGTQITTGSNGVDGRDELSENLPTTFTMAAADPARPGGGGPGTAADKLLLSEVCTLENAQEFIEIHNPNDYAVDLGDYYLTDAVSGTAGYWNLGGGVLDAATVGGGTDGDFHARFPDGFSISAGDTVVVAIAGSAAFASAYGFPPHLELFEDGPEADGVPDMRWIFGDAGQNSIVGTGSTPELADVGESVVLYHYGEGDDLVTDVDVFFWGTGTDYRFSKTGIMVGTSTYLDETAVSSQQPFTVTHAAGESYQRTDVSEGSQVSSGSNGVDGRDELSEDLPGTFGVLAADPARAVTGPGGEPAEKLLITEVNAGVNFYPDYGGIADLAMEFIEIHNPNGYAVDMSNYYITDAISYVSGQQLYWQIASGLPSTYALVGGGNYNDFTARFPDAYEIPPYGTIVLALAGNQGFAAVYDQEPDLELYEDGAEADDIPDMRPVFENSGSDLPGDSIYTPGRTASSDGLPRGIPELEEFYGEPVILYHWDEGNALVSDVDIFLFGDAASSANPQYRFNFDKTGVVYAGGRYQPDTPVASQVYYLDLDQSGARSYTRVFGDDEEIDGERVQDRYGSNGVDGRDETSENLAETFATLSPSPGRYAASQGGVGTTVALTVPAKTFLPTLDERFRIEFVGTTNSETRLRIFDLHGRLVITLFDSRFDGDASSVPESPSWVVWDGRDDTFERVSAGMYVAHLSVVDKQTGEEQTRTAPVVVATRLSR